MDYLIVMFPESRKVLVDGRFHGPTGEVLRVETGTREIMLDPSDRCQPTAQAALVVATTPQTPCVVSFTLVPESK